MLHGVPAAADPSLPKSHRHHPSHAQCFGCDPKELRLPRKPAMLSGSTQKVNTSTHAHSIQSVMAPFLRSIAERLSRGDACGASELAAVSSGSSMPAHANPVTAPPM